MLADSVDHDQQNKHQDLDQRVYIKFSQLLICIFQFCKKKAVCHF